MGLFASKPNETEVDLLSEIRGLRQELAVTQRRHEQAQDELKVAKDRIEALDTIEDLRGQIETLKIEKARKVEDNDRAKREVEHLVGLEKQRADFEKDSAIREAKVAVREEALQAQTDRFDDHIKFMGDRYQEESGYLRDILAQILERLPTVTIDRPLSAD
jgi:hypothetical protein